ncbi:hypothetical protein AD936_09925 [Gluconobacter japonicus]|nr:hypothetical protein AD936_09925 [Gluconobacter japonicus]
MFCKSKKPNQEMGKFCPAYGAGLMCVVCMVIKSLKDAQQSNWQNSATFVFKICDIYVAFSGFESESFSGVWGVPHRMLDPGFKS